MGSLRADLLFDVRFGLKWTFIVKKPAVRRVLDVGLFETDYVSLRHVQPSNLWMADILDRLFGV